MAKIFVVLFALFFVFGCVQQENVLTIYTYDSMVSEYGLGPKVIPKFEAQCDCNVNLIAKGDAGQVLATIVLEKDNPKADVVIGIDNSMVHEALSRDIWEEFMHGNNYLVPDELKFAEGYLTPYDYGYFAFMYDSEKIDVELNNFDDLLDPELEKSIAIQNPRASSPGLGLLLWTIAVYGDPGYKDFWRELKPNILIVNQSWDESAGLFAAGEVPIYLTYATSPPYYTEFENKYNLLGAKFEEGHYVQIEGMGIVKGTKKRRLAEQFIEFALTGEFQGEIPFTQFMFPVNQDVELPQAFKEYAIKPDKQLELSPELVQERQEEWISEWEKIMVSN